MLGWVSSRELCPPYPTSWGALMGSFSASVPGPGLSWRLVVGQEEEDLPCCWLGWALCPGGAAYRELPSLQAPVVPWGYEGIVMGSAPPRCSDGYTL